MWHTQCFHSLCEPVASCVCSFTLFLNVCCWPWSICSTFHCGPPWTLKTSSQRNCVANQSRPGSSLWHLHQDVLQQLRKLLPFQKQIDYLKDFPVIDKDVFHFFGAKISWRSERNCFLLSQSNENNFFDFMKCL